MGLYDAVRRERPRRRHPMWVAALAFAAALVTTLGLVISIAHGNRLGNLFA